MHANSASGIWEAVSLSRVTPSGNATPHSVAVDAWLASRAVGIKQLQLIENVTDDELLPSLSQANSYGVSRSQVAALPASMAGCNPVCTMTVTSDFIFIRTQQLLMC